MSLEAILEAIHASGETEAGQIESEARLRAEALLAEGRAEVERLTESARRAGRLSGARERARLIYNVRLESLRMLGEARLSLVEAALARLRERLAGVREGADYPALLRRLIEETLAGFGDAEAEPPHLEADGRDKALVQAALDDLGLTLDVDYSLTVWGGVIGYSADERVVVINTLEARLERAEPYLRRYLNRVFEEAVPEVQAHLAGIRVAQ